MTPVTSRVGSPHPQTPSPARWRWGKGCATISDSSSQTLSPRRCPVRPSLWGPRCWRGGRISSAVASSTCKQAPAGPAAVSGHLPGAGDTRPAPPHAPTSRCSGPRPARPKPTALCGAAWCSCAFYSDHQFHSDHQYWRLYVLTEGEERPLGQDSSGGHRHPTPRGSQKGVGIWPSEE